VAGKVTAADVAKLRQAQTVNGKALGVAVNGGKVTINNNAKVTAADVSASNGVIHVIDTVMLPADR
jgi:uncharacterized surface protein with fasciclin (FAS1) repeats